MLTAMRVRLVPLQSRSVVAYQYTATGRKSDKRSFDISKTASVMSKFHEKDNKPRDSTNLTIRAP
jgi:hypothetical protein